MRLLKCAGNWLDACTLDELFHSLPQRQPSDNADVYIEDGASTNPGATGCSTPIANAKNWKMMRYIYFTGSPRPHPFEINNKPENFTCPEPNLDRYITMTVESGKQIRLSFKAAAANTPVRIVSGSKEYNRTVATSWTSVQNFLSDGTTMTVYGDITGFDCSENGENITALNVGFNTALTNLICYNNQLTELDLSQNTELEYLICHDNNFSTTALDDVYCSLPDRTGKEAGSINPVYAASSDNHATVLGTNKGNATAKNWKVQYYKNDKDIPATTGSYVCGTSVRNVLAPEAVSLYPNPVEDLLRIKVADEVRTIHIYNAYGAEVASTTNSTEIKMGHLPAGVYAVRVETAQGIATQRVVKR